MKFEKYSPVIARLGVGLVFLVFGIWQLINPQGWLGYLPDFALGFGMSATTILILNGIFDIIVGLSLVTGISLRLFSALGVLHLAGIVYSLGWNDVAIRDLGLMIVLISIFLNGKDEFCFGNKK